MGMVYIVYIVRIKGFYSLFFYVFFYEFGIIKIGDILWEIKEN